MEELKEIDITASKLELLDSLHDRAEKRNMLRDELNQVKGMSVRQFLKWKSSYKQSNYRFWLGYLKTRQGIINLLASLALIVMFIIQIVMISN